MWLTLVPGVTVRKPLQKSSRRYSDRGDTGRYGYAGRLPLKANALSPVIAAARRIRIVAGIPYVGSRAAVTGDGNLAVIGRV